MSHTVESLSRYIGKRIDTSRPTTPEEKSQGMGETWGGEGAAKAVYVQDGLIYMEFDWGYSWAITPDTTITILPPRPIAKYNHHGKDVWVLRDVWGEHREHCLCFNNCRHFKPGSPDNCPIAQTVFETCVKYNLVTPVYECPVYEPSQE